MENTVIAASPLDKLVVRLSCWWLGCCPDYDALENLEQKGEEKWQQNNSAVW